MFDLAGYHKANSVKEVVELLSANSEARVIAGGTDILVRLHEGHPAYRNLVDIHGLKELKDISLNGDGNISIGSLASFTDLIKSEVVAANIPVLAQGAASVGGPQVRNMATIGGNIANGAPSADSAAPLLVLEAKVELSGPGGVRQVPITRFYKGPGKVNMEQDEVLTGLRIYKDDYQGWSGHYIKYAMREAMDIATIGCAAAVKLNGSGLVSGLRLAYTVAGPTPLRCPKAETAAKGMEPGPGLLSLLEDNVLADLTPRNSWRAAKDFREHLIKTLAGRAVEAALNGKEG